MNSPKPSTKRPASSSGGDDRQAVLLAEFVIHVPAAGGGVDDAGALVGGDDGGAAGVAAAVDHPMGRGGGGPIVAARLGGESAGRALGRQVVERPVVSQADQVCPLHRADDLVAALLLEDLGERFQLRHALRPGAVAAEAFLELPGEPLVVQRLGGEVQDRPVAVHPHAGVLQIGRHRAGDVAGQRPRRRRPGEQILVLPVADREPHEHAAVGRQPAAVGDLHL